MEKRKLIKFGKNSFVVSLPKEWLVANRLEKGAELFVQPNGTNVIIGTTETSREEKTVRISCDNKSPHELEAIIISHYKAGYTLLIVEGKTLSAHVPAIRNVVHDLAGAEIIEQSLSRLVVKDLIDVRQIALPTLISRMDMMLRSMFQDALSSEVSADVLRDRDRDLNRLKTLVARVVRMILENPSLGSSLGVSAAVAYEIDRVAWSIERIGDYVKRANGDILRSSPAARARLRAFLKETYDLYLRTMKIYARRSLDEAASLHAELIALLLSYTTYVHEAKDKDEVLALENIKNIMRDLRVILRKTMEMGGQPG